MNRQAPAHGQQGVALIIVLWLLVLMTVIAISHARIIRTETRLAANHVSAAKAASLAEAGAHHAIIELLVQDTERRWPVNGSINRLNYGDGVVLIAIRDARGLIDINRAPASLLDKLLAALGVQQGTRVALVDTILDWRDRDKLKRLHGAEDDDYRRAGKRWGARDGAFSSIEELRYVLGMTNPLYERLAPYLTVHSGQAAVSLEVAPSPLVQLLTGSQPHNSGSSISAGTRGNATYHVSVKATSKSEASASIGMVVRIAPASDQPFTILSWRAPDRTVSPAQHGSHG